MQGNKKAMIVTLTIDIRVIVDDNVDPDIDHEEFNKVTLLRLQKRLKDEGAEFIGENISTYTEDDENPYDYEYDS